jgi:small subunit ribosomal protein S4
MKFSKYKASRKLGYSLWGKAKDAFNFRNYFPGQHGKTSSRFFSEYGIHLRAKQALKSHYSMEEKQFKKIFKIAANMKGNTGENFVSLLERRVSMVLFRSNLASSIRGAYQLVSHGHVLVNGKKMDINSMMLKDGDVVSLRESSYRIPHVVEALQKNERMVPDYLKQDDGGKKVTFQRSPTLKEVPYPFIVEMNFVIEFYSK